MGPEPTSFLDRFAKGVLRSRWAVIVAALVIFSAIASGARHLSFSSDYKIYFGPDNPQLIAFNEGQKSYTNRDSTIVAIEPPAGSAFNGETLALVEEFTARAWELPYVIRVDSLSNYQHTEAEGDDLFVADLYEDARSLDAATMQRIYEIAANEPLLIKRMTSPSGHVIGLAISHQFPGAADSEIFEATNAERALRDEMLEKYPGHKIYFTGSNIMSATFAEASIADIKNLFPLMYLILVVVLYALLRSVAAVVGTVIVIVVSVGAAMGAAGYMGIALTSPSSIAPIVITTLAVADSVHLLVTFFANLREGQDKTAAMHSALRLNFAPIVLTSLTTALGLLSINFVDSPPLKDLGNIAAIGTLFALLLSLTLLPVLMLMMPVQPPAERRAVLSTLMERYARWLLRSRTPVFVVGLMLCVGLSAFFPMNDADDMFVHYFDETIQFRTDTDFIADNLTGNYTLEYSLPAPNGVADPDYLKTLEKFAEYWYQNPKVMNVTSIHDVFKRLNKNMHGDDPAYYRIPDDPALAAQYLLLYEFSLPFGLDLANTINISKDASRFVVTFEHIKSKETRQYIDEGAAWLRQHAPEQLAQPTGPGVMFAYIAGRNFGAMAIGIPLALIGISLLLIFALKSVKFGMISLLPNLFPLGMAFGVWAIFVGEINFTMSFSMSIILGIIVDDTIHFLSKYLRARRELGLTTEAAIVYSFRTVGTALVVTSLILAAGFFVLTFSAFYPVASMSSVTIIAIFCALATDFLLLPIVILWADSDETESISAMPEPTHA